MPILVFLLVLIAGLCLVKIYNSTWRREQALLFSEVLQGQAVALERQVSRSLSSAYIMGSLVRTHNGELPNFELHADNIIQSLGCISALQLAPKGVIKNIYPLAGHKKAIGHNILRDDSRRLEAEKAVQFKTLTLAGPFEVIQGGVAIIGRYPVFLKNSLAQEVFWGFASTLVWLEKLLQETDLPKLHAKGYDYQLYRIHPETKQLDIFAGSKGQLLAGGKDHEVSIPNGTWMLRLIPHSQQKYSSWCKYYFLLVLVFSPLPSYILYLLLKQPDTLRRVVDEKVAELESFAHSDALTGLGNRKLFLDRLEAMLERCQETNEMLALMFLDLDQFKRINDTIGHDAGDALLKTIAQRLVDSVREVDIIARLGGDEFVVMMPETPRWGRVVSTAECILNIVGEPVELQGEIVTIGTSIGITIAPVDGTDAGELMKNADLAMYHAKEQGRNNFQFYNPSMKAKVQKRLQMENKLRAALDAEEITVHYQPLVRLLNHRIVGVEAFVRWFDHDDEEIPTNEFIPLAEERGLIARVGDQVLKIIHRDACNIQKLAPNIKFSVNLSPVEFCDPDFLERITGFLETTDFSPSNLQFEIFEGAFSHNSTGVNGKLDTLKKLGISVAIDDFGISASSLSILKRLHANVLKIGREFLYDIPNDQSDVEIVSALVAMAHKLGLKVVAEGIERREQLEMIARSGCDFAQGNLFSKPLDVNEFCDVLEQVGLEGYLFTQPLAWIGSNLTRHTDETENGNFVDPFVQSSAPFFRRHQGPRFLL